MTPTDKPTQVGGLLPLPEREVEVSVREPCRGFPGWAEAEGDYYTADQMHAYAQANVQALEDTLRTLLAERDHRTDGDVTALAARCLHLSRGDRDLIAMRGSLIDDLTERKQALEARLVALEKDAARYRWLRDGSGIAPKFDYPVAKLRREGTTLFTTALDAAIDEAMKFYATIDAALLESKS